MVMRTLSRNRRSFDATTRALRSIDRYFLSRRYEDIEEANRNIEEAVEADGEYALAVFYRGVVHDLRGTPADAVSYFERIVKECDDDDLRMKARFNLGVAYYHRYSHRWLAKAEECFQAVIKDTRDEALVALAEAHRAQTHAMWMRPSANQNVSDSSVQAHIKEHFDQCRRIAEALQAREELSSQVAATAANAWGMANMYRTDHVAMTHAEKREYLLVSLQSLQKAEKLLPNDWANTCDLGSLSLRLGVLDRETGQGELDTHFAKAAEHLERVVNELRPGYGFALYELGILHRIWQKWDDASDFLTRATEVNERYRDISDKAVERQLERVANHDATYT